MDSDIYSIVICNNSKNMFISDTCGLIKKVNTETNEIVYNYLFLSNGVRSKMVISNDDQFLFLSGMNNYGIIKYDLCEMKQVKDFGLVFDRKGVSEMLITNDQKYLFVGKFSGRLVQIDVKNDFFLKDYDRVHYNNITAMACTSDSKYLFVSDLYGILKKISIQKQKVVKNYGILGSNGNTYSMALTNNDKNLFIISSKTMKIISVLTGKIIKDFGQVQQGNYCQICIDDDKNFFYTSCSTGWVNSWSL